MKNLIEFNGVYFNENTPIKVMQICSNANRNNRFRFWYGDKETGESWNDVNDVCGYIGRSTGTKKIPLLIAKKTSLGGGGLLCNCIVKIVDISTKTVIYQHPKFNQPVFDVVDKTVFYDGGLVHANCKSNNSALRLADFMNGKRFNK
jgi:hypothetical protein